jgi:hypothetical protein
MLNQALNLLHRTGECKISCAYNVTEFFLLHVNTDLFDLVTNFEISPNDSLKNYLQGNQADLNMWLLNS